MTSKNFSTAKVALFLVAAAFMLFPEIASAAPNFFTPQADDLSISLLLQQFFGGAMPSGSGAAGGAAAGSDPFAGMFKVINSAALTIGGIIAAYTLVAGTMQTAHDGEMLGKKWSSMWLPIRTTLGVGMVVPLGSGYCVAQLIVMWLAVQGVGLADMVWKAFATDGLSQLSASASAPSPKLQDFAIASLKIRTCMSTLDALDKLDNQKIITGSTISKSTAFTDSKFFVGDKIKGTKFGTDRSPELCGKITRTVAKWELGSTVSGAVTGAVTAGSVGAVFGGVVGGVVGAAAGGVGAIPGAAGGAALGAKIFAAIGAVVGGTSSGYNSNPYAGLQAIVDAHDNGSKQFMDDLKPVADAIAAQSLPNGGGAVDMAAQGPVFDAAVKKYIDAVQGAATGANASTLANLQANASSGGWLMAGAWFTRVASVINGINQAVNMVPSADYNKQNLEGENETISTAMNSAMGSLDAFYRSGTSMGSANAWRSSMGIQKEANGMPMQKQMEESKFAKAIVESMSGLDITRLQNDTRHPLITLQELGLSLMEWMSVSTLTLAGLSTLPIGVLVAPLIGLVLFSGISAATVLAVYTPLMPFLLFLGAAFGWLLLVIEAMAAAPLWAVMHLSPAGDDLMGSARQGYSLLLSLMLRPALIVIGFGASVLVVYPMGMLLNLVFFNVFIMSGAQGGSFFTVFMLIAGTVVYAAVLLSLLHKAFALIHRIPDELLKWFGGQGASLGQGANDVAHGARGAVVAVGGTIQNSGNTAMQAGGQMRQLGAQKAQNELSKQNAASGSKASAEKSSADSSVSSQKAFETGSPKDHLAAFNTANTERQSHMQAANDLQRAGRGAEAGEHKQQASSAGERMKAHAEEIKDMAASATSKYEDAVAANPNPSTSEEARALGELGRNAASAQNAYESVSAISGGTKQQGGAQQGDPKSAQFLQSAKAYEAQAATLPSAAMAMAGGGTPPPPPPAPSGGGGSGASNPPATSAGGTGGGNAAPMALPPPPAAPPPPPPPPSGPTGQA